jgi:hypothetical protein
MCGAWLKQGVGVRVEIWIKELLGEKSRKEDCRSDELSRRCLLELSILKRFTTVMSVYFAYLISVLNRKPLLVPI